MEHWIRCFTKRRRCFINREWNVRPDDGGTGIAEMAGQGT